MRSFIKILHLGFFYVFFCFAPSAALGLIYHMPLSGNDIVGSTFLTKVQSGDSVNKIMQRYELSYHELLEANPKINFRHLHRGQDLLIPEEFILPPYHDGIVINTAELRLYYFTPDGSTVYTYPVALGRLDWRTPLIQTKVARKMEDPIWYVPDSVRDYMLEKHDKLLPEVMMPGPENPLGKFALYLGINGYLIHGTNQPESVGNFVSSGCIRMMSDAIENLYNIVPVNTPVRIIHYANKAGWFDNVLYLEAHVPTSQYDEEDDTPLNRLDVSEVIDAAILYHPAHIDWKSVKDAVHAHRGIPQQIGTILE